MEDKMKIAIITSDAYLYQKLALELYESGFIPTKDTEGADRVIVDYEINADYPSALSIGKNEKADFVLPLCIGALTEKLQSRNEAAVSLCESERAVIVFGRKVRLTEIEYSLFSLLYRERGLVSKEKILKDIWNNEADGGVVNVYIHYLREKLERDGRKLILSSRQGGYRINELYL